MDNEVETQRQDYHYKDTSQKRKSSAVDRGDSDGRRNHLQTGDRLITHGVHLHSDAFAIYYIPFRVITRSIRVVHGIELLRGVGENSPVRQDVAGSRSPWMDV